MLLVTCSYCNSELPAGAMFCGECGRAVVVEPAVKPAHTGTARPRRRASAPGGSPSLVRDPVVVEAARDTKSSKSAPRARKVSAEHKSSASTQTTPARPETSKPEISKAEA